jgi:hypothetical protein
MAPQLTTARRENPRLDDVFAREAGVLSGARHLMETASSEADSAANAIAPPLNDAAAAYMATQSLLRTIDFQRLAADLGICTIGIAPATLPAESQRHT